MKRGTLLTEEQREYRRLAKQANQRAVRLERYLAEAEEAPRQGLQLYQYYIRQSFGDKKKRFPEDPTKLSKEQLETYTVELSNFLSADLSRVGSVRQMEGLYKEYKKQKAKEAKTKMPADLKKALDDTRNAARAAGAEAKVFGGSEKIADPATFFDELHAMYKNKLNKVMSYRDMMRILIGQQNRSKRAVKRDIAKVAGLLAANKELTYREIKDEFHKKKKKASTT